MPLHGCEILVVEDHYLIATELTNVLRQLGAEIVGPVGRLPLDASLANKQIDVALMNVELGSGPTLALLDEMADRGVPVALITGYGPDVLPAPYRGLLRLDKPIERDKLTAALLQLTGRTQGVAA